MNRLSRKIVACAIHLSNDSIVKLLRVAQQLNQLDKSTDQPQQTINKTILEKAKRVAPKYWNAMQLDKHKQQIKDALNTIAEPNTDQFYQAVYDYQKSKPNQITMFDGIIGPETFRVISNQMKIPQTAVSTNKFEIPVSFDQIKPPTDRDFNLSRFKEKIGKIESNNNYQAANQFTSARGKYQFLWKLWRQQIQQFANNPSLTVDQYLENPELQEKFMDAVVTKIYLPQAQQLQKLPKGSHLSLEQLVGLIHFKGIQGAKQILTTGIDTTTAYNIPVESYLKRLI
jgi:hypothetical protein